MIIGMSGDEDLIAPSGFNDTAALLAAFAARRVAHLHVPGAVYKVDGRTTGEIEWLHIKLAPRSRIEPVEDWSPAAADASNRSNAFFRVRGTAGTLSTTVNGQNYRGSSFMASIASTAGMVPGMILRFQSSPVPGLLLPSRTWFGEVLAVLNGTSLVLRAPATLPTETSGLTKLQLPIFAQEFAPATHCVVEGRGVLSTLGRNIACFVALTDFYGEARFEDVGEEGFSLFAVDALNAHGIEVRNCRSLGGSNGFLRAQSSHDGRIVGWSNDPRGAPTHANGPVQAKFWWAAGSSDWFVDGVDAANVPTVFHVQGAFDFAFGANRGRMLCPSVRWQRDPLLGFGFAAGAMFDGCAGPIEYTEWTFGVSLGSMHCADTYYDNSGGETTPGTGCWAFYCHDQYGTSFAELTADNNGDGYYGADGGVTHVPAGALMIRDCIGGAGGAIRWRNCRPGISTNGLGAVAWNIAVGHHESLAGAGQYGTPTSFWLDAGGPGANPSFGQFTESQNGQILFGPNITAVPDWDWTIGRYQAANLPVQVNLCLARDVAGAGFVAGQVAKLDPAAPAGWRDIVVALPGDVGCVHVAMGAEVGEGALKCISLPTPPTAVSILGASAPGDLLVAAGNAARQALVNNAALPRQVIGTVVNGTPPAGGTGKAAL